MFSRQITDVGAVGCSQCWCPKTACCFSAFCLLRGNPLESESVNEICFIDSAGRAAAKPCARLAMGGTISLFLDFSSKVVPLYLRVIYSCFKNEQHIFHLDDSSIWNFLFLRDATIKLPVSSNPERTPPHTIFISVVDCKVLKKGKTHKNPSCADRASALCYTLG